MFLLNRVLYNESTSCENILISQMNAQMIIRTFPSGNPLARAERTGDGTVITFPQTLYQGTDVIKGT